MSPLYAFTTVLDGRTLCARKVCRVDTNRKWTPLYASKVVLLFALALCLCARFAISDLTCLSWDREDAADEDRI
jgi:hypothetical protein